MKYLYPTAFAILLSNYALANFEVVNGQNLDCKYEGSLFTVSRLSSSERTMRLVALRRSYSQQSVGWYCPGLKLNGPNNISGKNLACEGKVKNTAWNNMDNFYLDVAIHLIQPDRVRITINDATTKRLLDSFEGPCVLSSP